MKLNSLFFIVVLFISVIPSIASAQTNIKETYFQHWTRAVETKNHVDINYRIIQCGTNNPQLHLQIFNESKIDQSLNFQVIVSGENGKSFTSEVSIDTKKASSYVAWCDSDLSTDKLKITIPEGYKPADVSVKIVLLNSIK